MNKLSSAFLTGLSFLVLLPGAKGGCVNDEVIIGGDGGGSPGEGECTLIGCENLLDVTFDTAVELPYTVDLTADGQSGSGTCDGSSSTLQLDGLELFGRCRADGFELVGAPENVTIQVTAGELAGTLTTAPAYQPVFPNGEACGAACEQGAVTLALTAGDGCYVGGCSAQLCTDDPNAASDCQWLPEYACYQNLGTCERGANGQCGWRDTADLTECIDNAQNRDPVDGQCIKNAGDTCATDADCAIGGCGGELCYNPSQSGGDSSCECGPPPVAGCGCVGGTCTWYD